MARFFAGGSEWQNVTSHYSRRILRLNKADSFVLHPMSRVKWNKANSPACAEDSMGWSPSYYLLCSLKNKANFFILHFSSWVTRVGVLKQSQSRRSSVSHIFFCNRWLRLFTAFFRTQNKAKSKPISRGSVSGESLSPFSRQIRNLLFHFGQNILIISACSVLRSAKYFARGTQSSEYRTSKLWVIFVKV